MNIGVLASGSGSNLQSIIDHRDRGLLDANIKVVVSNNPDAYALKRSEKHGIPTVVIRHEDFRDREEFDRRVIEILNDHEVELVVLAGFMRVITRVLLNAFPMKIMNIHPALLPAFPGIHAQQRAVEYGVKFSGCTVHFVDEGVDTGPVIIQSVVPVHDDDTEEILAARILSEEHRIYPQAIQFYAKGKIEITGRKVRIRDGGKSRESAMHNPSLADF
ncbi:MAG: phosphoribosylglycinamide formyltransferase [Syntrophales bacterium]|nr:phosphoribosylglycinamide formyltransferase [Syntrophales bacterium]